MVASKSENDGKRVSFVISTSQREDFDHPLVAFVFDGRGELADRVEVRDGKLDLTAPAGGLEKSRILIAPAEAADDTSKPDPEALLKLGAYEPVLFADHRLIERIDIPGSLIDLWPLCFCWVRGRVVRSSDNRAVCQARVHICEVDRLPWLIARLPDLDLYRLRDDLFDVIRKPPLPDPPPFRFPLDIDIRRDFALSPGSRAALRFASVSPERHSPGLAGVQAHGNIAALNPQPLPPSPDFPVLEAVLQSRSPTILRSALIENWKLLIPWFCYWPRWWWWLTCDELAVVTTDAHGRFERTIFYPCWGDKPDLYFWVEYDFGSGFEQVYRPPLACHTWWDYACGSEVTIRVTDPRVPGCEEEPDLPGRQVVVLSIGREIAVRELQTSGVEGVTTAGQPLGATLEPRVDFSRTELIGGGIPYYRWSYRRLSGPDGTSGTVSAGSVPIGSWSVMTRDVYRHYRTGSTYPSDLMGPMPTSGPGAAPAANLFRIRPPAPPSGSEWVVLNESVDLATAYFETASLEGAPVHPDTDDLAAGRYEMKLELFDAAGALVNWTDAGIDLRITDQDAPFGTGTVTTTAAPDYNRVLSGGETMGFRMVVRVDNSRCTADILPVGGGVTPDPDCGFHNYSLPTDVATMSFVARHPNGFATYGFDVTRGADPTQLVATSGTAGQPGTGGFSHTGGFTYSSGSTVTVSILLGSCSNAALAENLNVWAMATNGYGRLSGYDAHDNAAFALAQPCICPPVG